MVAAAVIQFRKDTIAAFEQKETLLRKSVTTEHVMNGNQAKFLVAGSGGASATTRGTNGMIPPRQNDNTQYTANLVEWHDKVRHTDYDIFSSQGDQKAIMQDGTVAVLNRKIDDDIITALNTGTQTIGASTGSLLYVSKAITKLANNNVPIDGQVSALITPAFEAYLKTVPQFTSADYVKNAPFTVAQQMFTWMGVNFIVHPTLPGAGGATEKVFFYHRSAVGHAMDSDALDIGIGYDDEDKYSWARASGVMGSVVLQNTGIIVGTHDGSAYS